MTATAPTSSPRRAHDETVRLRTADLNLRPLPPAPTGHESATVRIGPAAPVTRPLPKAVSAFDGKTVRLPHVIADVAHTVRQRYADLKTVERKPPTIGEFARLGLILLLAAMPILGISVDVLGWIPQSATSIALIVLTAVLATLIVFAPHRTDMIVGRGLIAGMVACIVYDGARLFAVHVLGVMGDFIPVMGAFVTHEPDTAGSAAVGYVWRYVGDAGGLGVAFFVFAFALGIDRWSNVKVVLASVAFAVFPTWTGLIATVALAPRGEEMMFALTPAAIIVTLLGHVIFGFFLGLAFLKVPRGSRSEWPWPPLSESAPVRRAIRFKKKVTSSP